MTEDGIKKNYKDGNCASLNKQQFICMTIIYTTVQQSYNWCWLIHYKFKASYNL